MINNLILRNLIGAEQKWQETNDQVYDNFASTGDWMLNSAPDLAAVIDAGVSEPFYNHCRLRGTEKLQLGTNGRL